MGEQREQAPPPGPGPGAEARRLTRMAQGAVRAVRRRRRRELDDSLRDLLAGPDAQDHAPAPDAPPRPEKNRR